MHASKREERLYDMVVGAYRALTPAMGDARI
jgi:hypothetical protein